jgi:hypothetical protein
MVWVARSGGVSTRIWVELKDGVEAMGVVEVVGFVRVLL